MFQEQIARGVALLYEQVPGWLERVNPDTLNMAKSAGSCGCILAQCASDHDGDRMAVSLGLGTGSLTAIISVNAKAHGFDAADGNYRGLRDEWKDTILRLRAERA